LNRNVHFQPSTQSESYREAILTPSNPKFGKTSAKPQLEKFILSSKNGNNSPNHPEQPNSKLELQPLQNKKSDSKMATGNVVNNKRWQNASGGADQSAREPLNPPDVSVVTSGGAKPKDKRKKKEKDLDDLKQEVQLVSFAFFKI